MEYTDIYSIIMYDPYVTSITSRIIYPVVGRLSGMQERDLVFLTTTMLGRC